MAVSDFYQDIIDEADAFYSNEANIPDYYPANTVAGIDPYQQQGLQMMLQAAPGQTALGQQYADVVSGYATGSHPAIQRLAQRSGQATADAFGGTGTYGSARQRQAVSQSAADTVYDNQMRALGQIPNAQKALTTGAATVAGVGDFYRGYNQDVINEDIKRHNYYEQAPEQLLQQRLGLGALHQAATGKGNITGDASRLGNKGWLDLIGADLGIFQSGGNSVLDSLLGGNPTQVGNNVLSGLGDAFSDLWN